ASASPTEDTTLSLQALFDINVSVASKQSEPIQNAPGIISVITQKDLAQRHFKNLYEAIQSLPGVAPFVGGQLGPQIALRGDAFLPNPRHVLIIIDGVPIRSELTDGPILKNLPISMVRQIEIIRGPGSVLYGSNAYTGVVSVVLNKQDKNWSSAQYDALVGAGGTNHVTDGAVGITTPFGLQILGSAHYYNTPDQEKTYLDYFETKVNMAKNVTPPDSYHTGNFDENGRGGYLDLNWQGISLSGYSLKDEVRTFSMVTGLQTEVQPIENRGVVAKYSRSFLESWTATGAVSYNENIFEKTDSSLVSGSIVRKLAEFNLNYNKNNLNAVVGGSMENISVGDDMTFQLRGRNTLLMSPTNQLDLISFSPMPNAKPVDQSIGYAQVGYTLLDKYKLIAGMQANKVTKQDLDYVPRIGAIANFSEGFYAKLFYAEAYRTGSLAELYQTAGSQFGNDRLKPEKTKTTDFQVGYRPLSWISTDVTLFNQIQRGLIGRRIMTQADKDYLRSEIPDVAIAATATYYDNLGDIDTKGIEWQATAYPTNWASLKGSATYSYAVYNETVEDAANVPDLIAKFGADFKLPASLRLNLQGTYIAGFEKDNGFAALNPAPNTLRTNLYQTEPTWLLDADLYWDATSFLGVTKYTTELHVGVSNLLDQKYYSNWTVGNQTDAFQANDERRFVVGLKAGF
ncbi:MAG: TonB-dependent receptor plug domain-containing protein, partial [Fibrobacterota bacterium]